ncbi:MAG: ATP-binding cassette domain-containing protein [Lachnospiraceae bacterium]
MEQLHPITQMWFYMLVFGIVLCTRHPLFLILEITLAAVYYVQKKESKRLRIYLYLVLPMLFYAILIQPLFHHRGATQLLLLFGQPVTLEVLLYGLTMAAFVLAAAVWFGQLGMVLTSDRITYLFGRIHPKLALFFSMTLRFVPQMKERYHQIHQGQLALGKNPAKEGVSERIRQMMQELSVLLTWSLEESIDLSDAMEARGYGLPHRSHYHRFVLKKIDFLFLVIADVLAAPIFCVIRKGWFHVDFYPRYVCSIWRPEYLLLILLIVLLFLLPVWFPFFEQEEGEEECIEPLSAGKKVSAHEELLTMKDFSFTYPQVRQPVIAHQNFRAVSGEFIVITGPSGCGKSTLLRQFKKELVPFGTQSGFCGYRGIAIADLEERVSAAEIGYIAQNPEGQMVCEKVWQEIAFGMESLGLSRNHMHQRLMKIARYFDLTDYLEWDTHVLSGGLKQRVLLASIFAMEPEVLLLDEPTSQLDPDMAQRFLQECYRLNREMGTTIVMVEHQKDIVLPYATRHMEMPVKGIDGTEWSKDDRLDNGLIEKQDRDKVLELNHVSFSYDSGHPVFHHFSFSAYRGEIVCVTGKNGSGKTTLLNLICGILRPEQGTVNTVGRIALVPQNPKALFTEVTVEEELPSEYLRVTLGLEKRKLQHPYDLSGGQQQRLAIGKVLETHPDIMLLDEPTKGLDAACKNGLIQCLELLARKGVTVICVSHDTAFINQVGRRFDIVKGDVTDEISI